MAKSPQSLLSQLPSVDKLFLQLSSEITQYGQQQVTLICRDTLAAFRNQIIAEIGAADAETTVLPTIDVLVTQIKTRIKDKHKMSLQPVINLTGTVLHTNLGRAPLPANAIAAVVKVASSYSNLEFNLESGKRGDRDAHIEQLLIDITGAEAATVVNNNAAAVMLSLRALAKSQAVVVSRGELVEIGGSFRIPEVMESSGCTLKEVGATNRTHLADYEKAINSDTAMLLKVHTSNYKIQGFTKSVTDAEVARLARKHKITSMTDLGSGSLVDMTRWQLPDEPTVQQAIQDGLDIVTFSGDKLLGGPQCGIIVGKKALIEKIKKDPMKRALRVDKMTIAALSEILTLYLDSDTLADRLPTLKYLSRDIATVNALTKAVLPSMQLFLAGVATAASVELHSQIGSGSLPLDLLPSVGIQIKPLDSSDKNLTAISNGFRRLSTPVIGRLKDGVLYFDLRTLESADQLINLLATNKLQK